MAATKFYRGSVRDEEGENAAREDEELWEEPLGANEEGAEEIPIFVASLLVDVGLLAATGQTPSGLGQVEVRKVFLREA